MANYSEAYNKTILNEGAYINDPDDPGGETYKGISRKSWSKWPGWVLIDLAKQSPHFPENLNSNTELNNLVLVFYRVEFWDRIQGDQISSQPIAESVFDFAVNAGIPTAVSLAQMVSGAKPDGIIGQLTVEAINNTAPELFLATYTLAKIARYISIVKKRPVSKKYFYGWVCRAIGEN